MAPRGCHQQNKECWKFWRTNDLLSSTNKCQGKGGERKLFWLEHDLRRGESTVSGLCWDPSAKKSTAKDVYQASWKVFNTTNYLLMVLKYFYFLGMPVVPELFFGPSF